jgi:carbamoyltransferase
MGAILGLNAYHGDAAAALVVDGQLVAAAEEERFTRIKHCAGFPAHAAAWCLAEGGVEPTQLDHVAVARNPKAHIGRKLFWAARHGVDIHALKQRVANAAKVGDAPSALADALGIERDLLTCEFHQVEHHHAHVASAFFVSPFERAAVLSADGFGDFTSTLLAEGSGSSFRVLGRVGFPHSLGMFYTALSQWLGFTAYGDEGKVMGLASYGEPSLVDRLDEVLIVDKTGFRLGLDYFAHQAGVHMTWDGGTPTLGRLFSQELIDLLGPPREPRTEITKHHEDVAASLQAKLEEAYLQLVQRLWSQTQLTDICIAGGVGLNALANGRVLLDTPFERIFVQPAAGDSGTAIGAAFWVWNQHLGAPRGFTMEHAYTGPVYSDERCAAAAAAAGLETELVDDDALFAETALRIASGEIVGWFQGRMEFGPRALGNRSILADPRRTEMKDSLNARVKHREPFRPFAPSILAEATAEWYEQDHPSPFMVLVYKTRPDKRELIPAVNHVDDTGRLQTVDERVNPRYWRLIKEFEGLTGVPLVLNTSFNDGEPIVMTPEDAIETFLKTRMDVLVLGNQVVRRNTSGTGAEREQKPVGRVLP